MAAAHHPEWYANGGKFSTADRTTISGLVETAAGIADGGLHCAAQHKPNHS